MHFQEVCEELSLEHEHLYSVSWKFEPQIDPEGNIKTICQICNVQITPGQKKQWLFNVRQHFMESSCHKTIVSLAAGRENVPSESVINLDMDEGKKITFSKKISPSTFDVRGGYVVCSFRVGSNHNNVHRHLQSNQHSAAAKGKNQGTLDAMFCTK